MGEQGLGGETVEMGDETVKMRRRRRGNETKNDIT